jgi:hypothetical protein
MRSVSRLGAANAALISLYFLPVWGVDALRALKSPYYGFEGKVHAVAASYYRALFDLGPEGLGWASNLLSGIKFVISIAFLAYFIDFVRAVVVGREPDRATLDTVLLLAVGAIMLWAWPAVHSGDAGLIRVHATEFLMLWGAMLVIVAERICEESEAARAATPVTPHGSEQLRPVLVAATLQPGMRTARPQRWPVIGNAAGLARRLPIPRYGRLSSTNPSTASV